MEIQARKVSSMVYRQKICVICLKNEANSRYIEWNDRKGFICTSCNEKTWDCLKCERYFYIGENKGYKPRHHTSKKRGVPCHGWKSEKRIAAEKKYGWINQSY